jgi:hypothetical protein
MHTSFPVAASLLLASLMVGCGQSEAERRAEEARRTAEAAAKQVEAATAGLDTSAIDVDTSADGKVVTLTGTVRSAADKAAAGKIARDAAPGAAIANHLTVR